MSYQRINTRIGRRNGKGCSRVVGMGYLLEVFCNEFLKALRDPHRILGVMNKQRLCDYIYIQKLKLKYGAPWSHLTPSQLVLEGYDRIAEEYASWTGRVQKEERARCIAKLVEQLPAGSELLDLGCGTGIPTTKKLAEHFIVTGVDISAESVGRAQRDIPAAKFIHADMMKLNFPRDRFDAVTSFYSIVHIPRREHPKLLKSIASWLRPNGLIAATMGAHSMGAFFEQNWFGVPMYWSSFDSETNERLFEEAGLHVIRAQTVTEEAFGKSIDFFWVIAQKPCQ
jgi:ubiquinone/menaquinone biosynthesis C-methylase UbiE